MPCASKQKSEKVAFKGQTLLVWVEMRTFA